MSSLSSSLQRLGTERVYGYALHEIPWSASLQDRWAELQSLAGGSEIELAGISGSANLLDTYPRSVREGAALLQTDVFELPKPSVGAGTECVAFGALRNLSEMADRLQYTVDPALDPILRAVRGGSRLAAVICASFTATHPNATLLIGSTSPTRFKSLIEEVTDLTSSPNTDWSPVWTALQLLHRTTSYAKSPASASALDSISDSKGGTQQ